jgi:hypothetical protein
MDKYVEGSASWIAESAVYSRLTLVIYLNGLYDLPEGLEGI